MGFIVERFNEWEIVKWGEWGLESINLRFFTNLTI
jgi:hypothetical protein